MQSPIHVFYGKEEISNDEMVSPSMLAGVPTFSWESSPDDLHTLLVYSASKHAPPKLAYVAVNIPDARLDLSEQIVPYQTPEVLGTYQVELLRQKARVENVDENVTIHGLAGLVKAMQRIGMLRFFLVSEDQMASEEARGRRCRCILHVAAKQADECLRHPEKAGQMVDGKMCYNPYPVCVKSTKVGGRAPCADYYDFETLPDEELHAFAVMEGVEVRPPYSRKQLVAALESWRKEKGIERTPYVART